MGEPFAKGLKHAAGVEGDSLDLSRKLGGDPLTALRAVMLFSATLKSLDLSWKQLPVLLSKLLALAFQQWDYWGPPVQQD